MQREQEKANPTSGYVDPFWDETRAERGDGELRLEQDILAPLSQSKKLYVFETKDFWRQIKSAGYTLSNANIVLRSLPMHCICSKRYSHLEQPR
jgi:hypothetical protein